MHPPTGPAFLVWLETSGLAAAMRHSTWMYPIVEIIHIIGFSILVGSVAMFDLRVLGLSKSLSVVGMSRHLLRWSVGSLLLIVPTGLMMFSAHATEFVDNPAFQLKMLLLVLAALNALLFHRRTFRSVAQWNTDLRAPVEARREAAISLALWVGIISCGRLIAYL